MSTSEKTVDARPPGMCAANHCPMAGSMSSGGSRYWCVYHFGCPGEDLWRVTSTLNKHIILRDMVVRGRKLMANVKYDEQEVVAALFGMKEQLTMGGYDLPWAGGASTFRQFIAAVEAMLGGLVRDAMQSFNTSSRPAATGRKV